jgi:hypothetical protein
MRCLMRLNAAHHLSLLKSGEEGEYRSKKIFFRFPFPPHPDSLQFPPMSGEVLG